MHRRALVSPPSLAALVLLAAALAACPAGTTPGGGAPAPVDSGSAPQDAATASSQAAAEAEGPFTAKDLDPVIRETGTTGVAPSQIVVELARPVLDPGEVGGAPKGGTVLAIRPPVEGTLRVASPSTIVFSPRASFAPGTRYEAALESVETRRGIVKAPPEGWVRAFETPAFDFVRLGLEEVDPKARSVRLSLTFSGPVDRGDLRRGAVFTVNGARAGRVDWERTDAPFEERVRIRDGRLVPGAVVAFSLAQGARSRDAAEVRTGPVEARVELAGGAALDIKDVYRAEGSTGHYVEVICDDGAVEQKRYYWDRVREQSYHPLSRRCVLADEDAARSIHFQPEVKFSVSPSAGGFRILGDFHRGTYALRIDAGAATVDGASLRTAYETTFTVPARAPQVHFVSQGRYLPREAWRNLPIRHLNVDTLSLTVRQVRPENLVFWMSDDRNEAATDRTSEVVLSEKVPVQGGPDEMTTSWIDVGSRLSKSTRGLLQVTASGGGAKDTARIVLTDLQLVAKRLGAQPDRPWGRKVMVWALDSTDLEPVAGVQVELVKRSGKRIGQCYTSGGFCAIDVPEKDVDPAPPFALVARKDGDLTYLKFADLEEEVEDERVHGEPYAGGQAYRASVYTDRGVYRPGERAHLVAIVRDDAGEAAKAGMPVELSLADPQGKVLRRTTLEVNEAGMVAEDVGFAAFATTGRYQATASVGKHAIGSFAFQVEEFVPERMKVEAAPTRKDWLRTQPVELDAQARYLFGGVPSGSRVEVSCELAPATFAPKENANYHYGVWRPEGRAPKPLALGTVSGTLDEKGMGRFVCPVGTAGGFEGPAELVARVAVFEAGSGRTTVGRAVASVHPDAHYVGLSTSVQKALAGQALPVKGVVVGWDGAPARDVKEVSLELVRLETEYGWYYDDDDGTESWRRWQRPVVESRIQVPVEQGRFTAELTPQSEGDAFLVRARLDAARTDLEVAGRGGWYWWAPEESRAEKTPRPGKATWIALDTPERVRVGEDVTVRFNAPWAGRVLLTAETDEVLRYEWRKVEPGEQTWSFELDRFVPNVYVTAFLVKDPHADSAEAFLPDRAFGVRSVGVEPVDYTHVVRLVVPNEVRSGSRLEATLDLGVPDGPTYATVAVVDEGVLSLTGFESPDPLKDVFVRRALGVATFETVGWTRLTPPGGPSRSTGGDAEGGEGALGRVTPVKPVALFSGVLKVPESGKLKVAFDLPAYRGRLRVMAVTAGPKRMGHAAADVVVRDPLVVQATLPRFLTRGDEIQIPVFVTNLSGRAREVRVRLRAETLPVPGFARSEDMPPPVLVEGKDEKAISLADGKGGVVVFKAIARASAGAAKLTVVASSNELESREESEVPLLPAGPKERRVQRIPLEAGKVDLGPYLTGWEPMSEQSTFWVTSNPYGEAFDHLKFLIHYPYGCIEQTTSSTRPLLYVSELVQDIDPGLVATRKIEDMVQAGIDRVFSMQTPSGGFAFWPGETDPVAWGTAYATHMLLDARKAGYPVPEDRLDEALAWMESELNNRYEKQDGGPAPSHFEGNPEPYMHYVLAAAGRGRKARIQRLIERGFAGEEAAVENRYLLEAALWLSGDRRYEKDLKTPDLSPVKDTRANSWTFYSDRRARGLMLSTFQDLFGDDPAGEPLANLVAESLKAHRSGWYSTQELVWGVTGLGKRVAGAAGAFAPPVLTADGRKIAANPRAAGSRSSDRTFALARASEYREVELTVPSKGEGRLYLVLASEGVREQPTARVGGEGLRIERRWLDASGRPIDLGGGGHALGDMVYVELTLTNTSPERVGNIALVDRLPAGWEIENPRLGRESQVSWLDADTVWSAEHMNVRDDRVEVFGSLGRGESRKVVYGARAVTAGHFTIPPVEAEAMYDPRIWARGEGRTVEIAGPWSDELN